MDSKLPESWTVIVSNLANSVSQVCPMDSPIREHPVFKNPVSEGGDATNASIFAEKA